MLSVREATLFFGYKKVVFWLLFLKKVVFWLLFFKKSSLKVYYNNY